MASTTVVTRGTALYEYFTERDSGEGFFYWLEDMMYVPVLSRAHKNSFPEICLGFSLVIRPHYFLRVLLLTIHHHRSST